MAATTETSCSSTIEGAKDQFKADELEDYCGTAHEQIREIEGKLTLLEQKYPGMREKAVRRRGERAGGRTVKPDREGRSDAVPRV